MSLKSYFIYFSVSLYNIFYIVYYIVLPLYLNIFLLFLINKYLYMAEKYVLYGRERKFKLKEK